MVRRLYTSNSGLVDFDIFVHLLFIGGFGCNA